MNKRYFSGAFTALVFILAMAWILSGQVVSAASPIIVYGDGLKSGWANWSWNTTMNFNATNPVHSGSKAISAKYNAAGAGVYLRSNPAVGAGYDTLRFWINGGTGAPKITVSFYGSVNNKPTAAKVIQTSANTWTQVDVPLAVFGSSSSLWGIGWQESSGKAQPVFYIDDVQLLALGSTQPQNSTLIPTQAASPTTVSNPISSPPGTGWTMVFNDEFNGTTLDASKWSTCYHWALDYGFTYCRAGNDELQWYQPDDVSVQNGQLHLKAEKRSVQGANYTSGMVDSHGKFNFLYGYVEARFRVPKGKGLWPAFWMLPQDKTWPPEIDIMEILGDKPNLAYTTLHWGQENNSTGKVFSGPDFSADFHTFAVNWQPGSIIWYIDGAEVFRTTANTPSKAMYVILNLAVGGAWPGSPNSSTVFPSTFDIDYVRVWQQGKVTASQLASIQSNATAIPLTYTAPPPTATPIPMTNTPVPTDTMVAATETSIPATAIFTSVAPTLTVDVPTSTPVPTGPTLTIQMSPANAAVGSTVSAALKLSNVSNLYGLQTECQVDPSILSGTGHTEGDIFGASNSFIIDASYQADGKWSVASSLLNPAPAFNGSGTAFSLNFNVLQAGQSAVTCTVLAVDVDGNLLPLTVVNGQFVGSEGPIITEEPTDTSATFTPVPVTDVPLPTEMPTTEPTLTAMPEAISGVVKYEKRDNQTGIAVTMLLAGTPFLESQSNADGSFQFDNVPAGQYVLQFKAAGYLTTTAPIDVPEGQGASVQVTLLAGDIDGNGTVDLTDASFIGANYQVQVPPAPTEADLNGDGFINLVDLVLVGKNFGKSSS